MARDHLEDLVITSAGKTDRDSECLHCSWNGYQHCCGHWCHTFSLWDRLGTPGLGTEPAWPRLFPASGTFGWFEVPITILVFCSEVVACRRSANKAAHELAILGKNCNAREALIWEVDLPQLYHNKAWCFPLKNMVLKLYDALCFKFVQVLLISPYYWRIFFPSSVLLKFYCYFCLNVLDFLESWTILIY